MQEKITADQKAELERYLKLVLEGEGYQIQEFMQYLGVKKSMWLHNTIR